jgi:putative ABC transport system permease protein
VSAGRSPRGVGVSGRWIWLLIRLFPGDFRENFGEEMLAAFLDYRDALLERGTTSVSRRAISVVRFTCTTTVGLPRAALREHLRTRGKERRVMSESTDNGGGGMTDLRLDIRYGIRALRRTPGFTLVALLTLALGIGATTAMFSVLDAAMRRSLPYPEPERLVLGRTTFSGNINPYTSFPDYLDYRDQSETLESLATIGGGAGVVTITGTSEPEQAREVTATSNIFSTLGVAFQLGGTFTLDEQPPGGGGEVVISHSFWQSWFGGDSDALGRSLFIDGDALTVVGVLPAGFRFFYDTDLWVPPWPGNSDPLTRRYHNWFLVGRLAPDVSLTAARAEIDVIAAQLEEAYPDSNRRKGLQLDGLHSALVERYRQSLLILAGAIVFVLLIACGNVANLLLARGSTRTAELSVRAALGATRSRLTRQLMVECLILALVAGSLGVVLAVWLQNVILSFVSMDRLGDVEVGLSLTTLGFALGLSLFTVLLFGVFPSVAAARANPAEDLKQGSRGSTSGRGIRYRSGLVVLQVALSLVLLVGSGLLIRSFARLSAVDPGFRVENMLTATVSLPTDDYQEGEQRVQFFQSLRESIEGLPGVETVSMVNRFPILQTGGNVAIWAPERPPETNNDAPWADQRSVLPGYFATMDIPLVEGRVLAASDVEGSPPVLVLNRNIAESVYPDESAVGRLVAVDVGQDEPGLFEVVGVVEDHQLSSLAGSPRPAMFFPYAQRPSSTMRLAVATATDPLSLIRPIQERIWELDRDIVLSGARSVEDGLANSVASTRSVTTVLGMFAGVALALAALGLYGVLAFFVTQRIHEIGIRLALGAPGGSVLRLVVSRGLMLVGGGLVLGTAGAFGATRLVEGMLFQTSAKDPITFAAVTGVFLLVALGACLVPAWRASRVDPLEALRVD